jgi:hypothetical protein
VKEIEALTKAEHFVLSDMFGPLPCSRIEEALFEVVPRAAELEMVDAHVRVPGRRFGTFSGGQLLEKQCIASARHCGEWAILVESAAPDCHVVGEGEVTALAAIGQDIGYARIFVRRYQA